jgi:D-amino-acid oxidase
MPFAEHTHQMAENQQVHQWRSKFLPNVSVNHAFILRRHNSIDSVPFSTSALFLPCSLRLQYRVTEAGDDEFITEYNGCTMHAPAFLAFLQSELESSHSQLYPASSDTNTTKQQQLPVTFVRAEITSLSDVFQHVPDAQLIINATGLGAKDLKDVRDDAVYPIRGQTVIIKPSQRFQIAPRCAMKVPKSGNYSVEKSSPEEQEFTYVIPRARSGQVICGGCAIPNEWSTDVDAELTRRILQRCIEVVPELLEEGVDPTSEGAWKTLEIVGHGVGLRPARRGGLRLELENMTSSEDERQFCVLHAYGAGAGGYQSSHGTAVEALALVEDHFNRHFV